MSYKLSYGALSLSAAILFGSAVETASAEKSSRIDHLDAFQRGLGSKTPAAPQMYHSSDVAAYSVVYSFVGLADGIEPLGGLTYAKGALYGTTSAGGGSHGSGIVFKVSLSGAESIIHTFGSSSAGSSPHAKLLYAGGNLFSTTIDGGTETSCISICGTVFEIGQYGKHTIYSFKGAPDGGNPLGNLLAIDGVGYGTTAAGGIVGAGPARFGNGTIYRVDLSGSESVLHAFAGAPNDGAAPGAGLVETNGYLYGATSAGGSTDNGTIFRIGRAKYEKLFSFKGPDGSQPSSSLINVNGTLYGTTTAGGSTYGGSFYPGYGTVFGISPSGAERVLYSFKGGADGRGPSGAVVQVNDFLYGTTQAGGLYDEGTIFKVDLTGHETILHSFGNGIDGKFPNGDLIFLNGMLYGTTGYGGNSTNCAQGCGTVFSKSP